MKDTVEGAARDVENSIHTSAADFEKQWGEATGETAAAASAALSHDVLVSYPEYRHPRKKWRIKQGATPQWYKARHGIRSKAMSGAARVARFRPKSAGVSTA